MGKARTAMFIAMMVATLAFAFSMTGAYPTTECDKATTEKDDKLLLGNNSRLVITNVVKTIEFEVGVLEDDGTGEENSTDPSVTEFYETDIQLLDVDLLKEVINHANETKHINETKLE